MATCLCSWYLTWFALFIVCAASAPQSSVSNSTFELVTSAVGNGSLLSRHDKPDSGYKPLSRVELLRAPLKFFLGKATSKNNSDGSTLAGNQAAKIFVYTVIGLLMAIVICACIAVVFCGTGKKEVEKNKMEATLTDAKPKAAVAGPSISDALKGTKSSLVNHMPSSQENAKQSAT